MCRVGEGEGEGEGLRSGQSFQRILNMLVNETIAFTSLALNMRHRGRLFKTTYSSILCISLQVATVDDPILLW